MQVGDKNHVGTHSLNSCSIEKKMRANFEEFRLSFWGILFIIRTQEILKNLQAADSLSPTPPPPPFPKGKRFLFKKQQRQSPIAETAFQLIKTMQGCQWRELLTGNLIIIIQVLLNGHENNNICILLQSVCTVTICHLIPFKNTFHKHVCSDSNVFLSILPWSFLRS